MNDNKKKSGWEISNIVGYGAMFLILFLGMGFGNLASFIDIPSIQIVILITIAGGFFIYSKKTMQDLPDVIAGTKIYKSYKEAKVYISLFDSLSRLAIASGMTGTLIGMILMLGNMADVQSIGPNMAVALLCPLIAIIFSELILQPMKQRIILEAEKQLDESNIEVNYSPLDETASSSNKSNPYIIIFVAFLPLLGFISLLSFVMVFNGNSEKLEWESFEFDLSTVIVNGEQFQELQCEDTPELCAELSEICDAPNLSYFKSESDTILSILSISPNQKINDTEILADFLIITYKYNPETDECLTCEGDDAFFLYPISIGGTKEIRFTDSDIDLEMTVTTEKNIDE